MTVCWGDNTYGRMGSLATAVPPPFARARFEGEGAPAARLTSAAPCTRPRPSGDAPVMRRELLFSVPAVALGLAAQAPDALADEAPFLTLGLLMSIPFDAPASRLGLGVEASYHAYPTSAPLGVGGFLQAQYLLSGGWRVDVGAQGSATLAGAELGFAVVAPHATDLYLGLHTALYASAGYGGAAFRWTPRLGGAPAPRNHELSVAVNLKLFWNVSSHDGLRLYEVPCTGAFGCSIGRPLVVGEAAARPALQGAPAADDAAARWARAAADEYASVAAFARASLALMALGAPPELVARTHRAALDEVDHARRCAALAARFGAPVTFGAFPEAVSALPPADLAGLAVATVIEGCVHEGAGAEEARRALARADDPAVREALEAIARDEAEHARLAWDTVAWCCEAGGEPVRRRVVEALLAQSRPSRGGALASSLRAATRRLRAHPRRYDAAA